MIFNHILSPPKPAELVDFINRLSLQKEQTRSVVVINILLSFAETGPYTLTDTRTHTHVQWKGLHTFFGLLFFFFSVRNLNS